MKMLIQVLLMLCTMSAMADQFDYADVTLVRPIYRTTTSQQCDDAQAQPARQERGIGGAVVGGVAGAILGNQVGQGNGNIAATAVGGIAGAIVGDRMQNGQSTSAQPQRICHDVQSSVIDGYDVSYRYNGISDTIRMNRDPGRMIRVKIVPAM